MRLNTCTAFVTLAPVAAMLCMVGQATALPIAVEHAPTVQTFGEASGITQRAPAQPREGEPVVVHLRISFQFQYDRVALYYTTDGSEPQGLRGSGFGTTQVLTNTSGGVQFTRNENTGQGVRDWWRASLPAATRQYGQRVRYKLSAWSSAQGPSSELFTGGAVNSAAAVAFEFSNKLAWPGQGSAFPGAENVGYPPVHFWKEEGVVGNNWINQMIDQNGSIFDVYYPGAGGVQGVGTKNEGYVDGLDTFPAGLPLSNRGQMHLNTAMTGLRFNGRTYWMSNSNGTDFGSISQVYTPGSNSISTSSTLVADGANIRVQQSDFAPKGIVYPNGGLGKGMTIKRMVLTNQSAAPRELNVYFYADSAINGGDQYDASFFDAGRGAMVHYDNTYRIATNTGPIGPGQEYNPTTFSGYEKNVSVYLAMAMKNNAVGGAAGTPAQDGWRDTSGDNGIGWIGQKIVLAPGESREVSFLVAGGFDGFAGATGTYNSQIAPVIDWFASSNVSSALSTTDAYWQGVLDSGVRIVTPDANLNTLLDRGLLTTLLHFDEKSGGLIAGFRNGAYPYVWPRDMAWAGVTLARTGHVDIVRQMTRYLRDITFRAPETWNAGNTPGFAAAGGTPFYGTRKGFWRQKYTTDGYVVWSAPQVDETAVFPWMVYYNYLVEGDAGYFGETNPSTGESTYSAIFDAAIAMSQTSTLDGARMNLRPSYSGSSTQLMYSNNIWEDSYDTFIYSNANIVRGLRDAANIAGILGLPADASNFTTRANAILSGINDKLDWNRENTDISLLGIVYPFETHSPTDPRVNRVVDRINGVAADGNGQTQPLVRFANQYQNNASDYVGLLDRYWGDGYWGNSANGPTPAGPWFLSTMWYGVYYAQRQDLTPGKADIDNHLFRLQRTADHNGPLGLGAEQMAPANSLLYPGQSDFTLQTAWPNAWESMSFYVDAMMQFIDYTPDAPGNTLRLEPKLPTAWGSMTYSNLRIGTKTFDVTVAETADTATHTIVSDANGATNFSIAMRIPGTAPVCDLAVTGGTVTTQTFDAVTRRLVVTGALSGTAGGITTLTARTNCPLPACLSDLVGGDGNPPADGNTDGNDFQAFLNAFGAGDSLADIVGGDGNPPADGNVDGNDFQAFLNAFGAGC